MLPALLIHTVEVYRRSGRVDRFGQPVDANPRQHSSAPVATHRCRVTRGKGGLVMMERALDVFEQRWTMYTELGADIQTDDAIRVLNEKGEEIVPMCKIINKSEAAGMVGGHHLEFALWAQSGPS